MRFLLISAGLVLIFSYKSFALPEIQITLDQWTFDFNNIANVLFLITSVVMFVILIRYILKESSLRTEKLLVEGSKKYMLDLEESYKTLRTIRHDYVNILTSFKLYIDNEDMSGLTKYYYDELSEINKGLLNQNLLVDNLQNLKIDEIKSILIYKCSLAAQHKIEPVIEVKEPIENLGISTAIVCQMLGILLDNAIEGAAETEITKAKDMKVEITEIDPKVLQIAIVNNPNSTVFIIKNIWQSKEVSIDKLFELGFSTKGQDRGMGLYTLRKYTEKLKGLYLETEVTDKYFTQTLTVKDD
jgi:two-component system sensor histidine kinase AgrC